MSVNFDTSRASITKTFKSGFQSYDVYIGSTLVVCTLLAIAYYPFVANAYSVISQDLLIALVVSTLIVVNALIDLPLAKLLRRFYVIPIIWMLYDQVHVLVPAVNSNIVDTFLIQIDRTLFGVDPTIWLSQFSNRFLTEYLQICYFSFYILPIMQGIELWKRGDLAKLDEFLRAIVFCYMISYLAYFFLPAVGPRFTLHRFDQLDYELPGVFFTSALRNLVSVGGGIPQGSADPMMVVNRDCMPSGHTMLTLVNIILAFRLSSRLRWFFVIVGGSLIFSTVYLRYHYVVDVLVGGVFVFILLWVEPKIHALLTARFKNGG